MKDERKLGRSMAAQRLGSPADGRDPFADSDEFEHAIGVLSFVKSMREAARTDPPTAERIAQMAQRMRRLGEQKRSPLLVGIAEALEDWLINWV